MSIENFFAFARERHAIYLRRKSGVLLPYTTDPILQQYKFTNVFRELDRTTVWFRENVRDKLRNEPEVLLATVLFRWFNRITTGEAVFSQLALDGETAWEAMLRTGDVDPVRAAILQYCGDGPYVTGAYIIKTPDGMNKLNGVLQCIKWFMLQEHPFRSTFIQRSEIGCKELVEKMCYGETTLQQMWSWLKQFPFLGDFMAYEIVTDLRHTALLDKAPDIMTWANPGPGAARGLGRVFHDNKDHWNQHRDKQGLILRMQELLSASRDSNYWPQNGITAWEMRDVEHTLCEFDKYERTRLGEGRPRGTFRP